VRHRCCLVLTRLAGGADDYLGHGVVEGVLVSVVGPDFADAAVADLADVDRLGLDVAAGVGDLLGEQGDGPLAAGQHVVDLVGQVPLAIS
jgi:hypothetical protein